ncbi:hypothetical protein vBEfaS271_62 [Enterococcus phage vB_EfaS-271]|nr:hypothetical protein vBEfaS271_62 [Enterococcus phage vB_EfaS-271]
MKKKTIKEFCGMNNVTEYIESLGEETTIISHTIQGEWHYIITEYEVLQERKAPEFNRHMKERVKQWCTARKVYYSEHEPVFTSSKMLRDDFNDWNNSDISYELFMRLFKEVGKDGGNILERTRLRVNGEPQYGFIGVKINGCYSKQL